MNCVKEREYLSLLMGKVVLSLRSCGGDTLTRWLNEVRRKINGINT